MELWFLIFIFSFSLCLAVALNQLLTTTNNTNKKKRQLPPGPPTVPILGNLLWLTNTFSNIESVLSQLRLKYGPIISIRVGSHTLVFISDASLAHKALVQNGSTFSDRPPALAAGLILSKNQNNISSANYGPLWRLLRRNLMSEILHPSRIKSYSQGRKWVLDHLIEKLKENANSGESVCIIKNFEHSMFRLLLLMCFGQKFDENTVKKIETAHKRMLVSIMKSNFYPFLPKIGKIIFRKRWNDLVRMRREQAEILVPFIRACEDRNQGHEDVNKTFVFCYVDSLLGLELLEEGGRKLTEGEMVSLCSEFLTAGIESTSTSFQWIMANLVKNQDLQQKLVEEIVRVVGKEAEEVGEEDLNRLIYLKAVILEGLRRHPPGHFVLPHAVSEEVTFEGYVIPKDTIVNFTVADIGMDEKVWEEPMAFRPERFLDCGENVDITGSREIKMMPFGAGRRMCPGLNLAMLHLEYFVANMMREFEWKTVEGEEVDLTEKQEVTVVMKKPLKVKITQRRRNRQAEAGIDMMFSKRISNREEGSVTIPTSGAKLLCPSSLEPEKGIAGKQRQGNPDHCNETDLGSWDRTVVEKKTEAVPPQPELIATTAFRCPSLASEKGRRRSPVAESLFCSKEHKPSRRRECPLRQPDLVVV
ncbi:cytochrome P450 89A2 [Cinnamomum micranthum f. kanehirae]|uniref:Cytochrome P450 89A2 n=1 Tax=Cinnamomum micranthum f. kanehirae TaxID=337451 RepID=A0A3S3P731_9MAGN|nr:cytochrome P450 89A2 [Cinnamomum micranthum f. kanehirae]